MKPHGHPHGRLGPSCRGDGEGDSLAHTGADSAEELSGSGGRKKRGLCPPCVPGWGTLGVNADLGYGGQRGGRAHTEAHGMTPATEAGALARTRPRSGRPGLTAGGEVASCDNAKTVRSLDSGGEIVCRSFARVSFPRASEDLCVPEAAGDAAWAPSPLPSNQPLSPGLAPGDLERPLGHPVPCREQDTGGPR